MTHVVHSGKIFSHAANARVICLLDRSADSSTVQATHTTATDRLAIGATASISASSPPGLSDGLIGVLMSLLLRHDFDVKTCAGIVGAGRCQSASGASR